MNPNPVPWEEIPVDQPISLLKRQCVHAEQMLVARVVLEKGCLVKVHSHESEQMAIMLAGHAMWTLGEDQRQVEMHGGEIIRLPSNYPHGLVALEDCLIIDVLSPSGPMGVDSQD